MASTVVPPVGEPVSGSLMSVETRVVAGATVVGTVTPPEATEEVVWATTVVGATVVTGGVVVAGDVVAGAVVAGAVVGGAVVGGAGLQVTVPDRGTDGESVLVPLGRSMCQCTLTTMVTTPVAVIGSSTALTPSIVCTPTGTPLAVALSMTIV